MMRARTLVGRMARIQVFTMVITLGTVVVSSLVVVTRLVGRERDRALMNTATAAVAALSDLDNPAALGPRRLAGELDQHRPGGVRIEAVDGEGAAMAAVGEGPRLHPAGDDNCIDQEGWRVCERAVGALRVLVGRSRGDEDATKRRVFLVLTLASAAVIGIGALLSRGLARRGLRPMRDVALRLENLTPGRGERLPMSSGLAEIDEFARHFDGLLARVDEAVARERRFAAQASHELRTPLTVLRAELEELVARPSEDPGAAARALASADRLIHLVESLLLFGRAESRFDPSDLELVNLCDLVKDEIEHFPAGDKAPVRLAVDLPDELLLLGNERLLGRAVSNLLDNALKYAAADTVIDVAGRAADGVALLTVSDTGPGIPTELRERVFEPFYRDPHARAARPGHGLGLPLARAVARAHGGDLELLAGCAGGSVFELSLPLLADGQLNRT
jgi:signal transduction histidine kinase